MLTLSHGVKKPEAGDKGSQFFPALEANMQLLNDHNHDGNNSSTIVSTSVTLISQNILAANWVLVQQGLYRQAINIPAGMNYAIKKLIFKEAVTGDEYMLSTDRIDSFNYWVYIADNTISLTVFYL
jgi:hypothetical protein